ncbi:Pycsar system effector family protein [Streptomyces sp. NPDC057413]|uniref:Pycsar system effector family protein n=1 Tax=Streptomyces sp. NPDC057413 TaxID=3346124 RepID=UPI0036A86A55
MTPGGTVPHDPAQRAGTELLADLRAEITRADAKATVLVGALGISAGLLAALLTSRGWSPGLLSGPAAVLWWAGTAGLVVALFALVLAVMPRYGRVRWTPDRPLTYFGDVRQAARSGRLAAALTETGREPIRGLLLALAETSAIAARKHFWIRTGLAAFGLSAVLLPGSLLLS